MRPIPTLLAGNLLGTAAAGVFFLTASWSFDLEEMGRYAVAISVQWIAVGLLGTGLSTATVRLATDRLLANDRPGAAGFVALAIGSVAAASLVTAILLLGVSALGPGSFALSGEAMVLVVLWAGTRALVDCIRSGLLAQQQFSRVAVLMVLTAATGLGALGVALLLGPLRLERLLGAHVAGLGTGALAGCALLAPLTSSGFRASAASLRELLAYARWPALSEGTRLLQVHLGPLALVTLAGSAEAGLFSLGRYPAYLFEVVAVSMYQYWLPTAAKEESQTRLVRFMFRQMRLAALLGLGMCAAALAVRPLLPWLGDNFAAAAHLFVLNALDFALLLLTRPIEATFHGLHRPRLELFLRMATLPILGAGALFLASRFGAEGMVWAHVLMALVALPVGLRLVWGALEPEVRREVAGGRRWFTARVDR